MADTDPNRPVGNVTSPTDETTSSEPQRDRRSTRGMPLVTARVGTIFLMVAVMTLICAAAAHAPQSNPRFQSLMWIAALAICSVGGLVAMSSVRTLRVIEEELRRKKDGTRRWQTARPIASANPIAVGWNELLEDVSHCQQVSLQPRSPADLDQEAITLARAMRGLPVAWVITDVEGTVRFLGPATCGLLDLAEEENHKGRDLPELIGPA